MTLTLQRRSLGRWIAGALIAFVSLVQAMRTLAALPGRPWSLGGLAIGALAVLTVVGMVGLFRARLRIERELLAMRHQPPGGALIGARRERLTRIATLGGRPDADALAEEAAAGERGRAYLGRYLVAVAVLIGLVGTFSGLADALRALPSIFNGAAVDPSRLAELMQGAMTGLDLTFAAGIVGILSTLALSLVQGDLQVHEEAALARLEEVTAHELVPTLWPANERAEERALHELTTIRTEAQSVRMLVAETSATLGATFADALRSGMTELRAQQAESLHALGETLARTTDKLALQLASLQDEVGARAIATQDVLMATASEATQQLGEATAAFSSTAKTELGAVREAMTQAVQAQHATITSAIEQQTSMMSAAVKEQSAAISGAAKEQSAAISSAAKEQTAAISTAMERQASMMSTATERQSATLSAATEQQHATIERAMERTTSAMSEAVEQQTSMMSAAVEQQTSMMSAAVEQQTSMMSAAVEQQTSMMSTAVEQQTTALASAAEHQSKALSQAAEHQSTALSSAAAQQTATTYAAAEQHGATIAQATEQQTRAIDAVLEKILESSVGAFAGPAAQLADAASTLAETQRSLSPQLEALTPELRALTAEVALLGSRKVDDDEQPLFADELVRLGEGMSRLEALVQLSQQGKRQGARG